MSCKGCHPEYNTATSSTGYTTSSADCGGITLSELPTGAIPISPPAMARQHPDPYGGRYMYPRAAIPAAPMSPVTVIPCSVTPLKKLKTARGINDGQVRLTFVRKASAVTMCWESFEGCIGQNGVSCLRFEQSLPSPPPGSMKFLISITYKGKNQVVNMFIDPMAEPQLMIFLDLSESGEEVQRGDAVSVPGGSVNWITFA